MAFDSRAFSDGSASTEPRTAPRILPQRAFRPAAGRPVLGRLCLSGRHIRTLRYLSEITYPFEACGLLVGRPGLHEVWVDDVLQAGNLSEHGSRDRYVLDPEDFLAADRSARRDGRRIVGIWHSHPNHPAEPSTKDLKAAWHGYSYVIVSVDALGDTVVRSWRLEGSRLTVEPIEVRDDGASPTTALD